MGGGWCMRGQLPLGSGLIVFAGLLQQFSNQVFRVSDIANSMQTSLTGARRVFEVLDTPIEIAGPPSGRAIRLPRARGEVRFENVWFDYKAEHSVLRGVDFRIEPGCCVAILGATGAGKSALLGFDPPLLRSKHRLRADRRPRFAHLGSGRSAAEHRTRFPGELSVLEHHCRQYRVRPSGGDTTRRSSTRRDWLRRTISSWRCPPVTRVCWARAPRISPAASGSGWRSPGRCCWSRRSCSSTIRPPPSIPAPNTRFSVRWTAPWLGDDVLGRAPGQHARAGRSRAGAQGRPGGGIGAAGRFARADDGHYRMVADLQVADAASRAALARI